MCWTATWNRSPSASPASCISAECGLARGYLGRPGLTAERFVPDPFGAPGTRLYKSGDLARWRPDGSLDFLGRLDHQVKIHGFRIELGEIEAALAQHPDVGEAVVLALSAAEDTDRRLVAYLVATGEARPTVGELRRHLQTHLPDYMLPAAVVSLPSFPLTTNGKLDRAALPAPAPVRPDLEPSYVAPRTPVEGTLAAIWASVLGLEQIGVHDNFFELGGHSLLATQCVSRIRELLHIELPVRVVFECPTVARLAAERTSALRTGLANAAPVLGPQADLDRTSGMPLSFGQERIWFLEHLVPGSAAYNVPIALRLSGDLDLTALEASVSALLERHEALRTRFAPDAPKAMVESHVRLALEIRNLQTLPAESRMEDAMLQAQAAAARPFDLTRAPLFRAVLFQLSREEHILLLSLHHLIFDGLSTGILLKELGILYTARLQGDSRGFSPPCRCSTAILRLGSAARFNRR